MQAALHQSENLADDAENGTLAYTKISYNVYYRPEDVKAVFPVAEMKLCITAGKERKCNVTNEQTNKQISDL